MIEFRAAEHTYTSIFPDDIEWVGATTLVKNFCEPFNPVLQATKSSKNKKSKWYGMDPHDICYIWLQRGESAADTGTIYHGVEEQTLISQESILSYGKQVPVFPSIMEEGVKIAPEQKLVEGVYPEHLVYLKTVGVCGQADRVDVVNDLINVLDHKTYDKLKYESYRSWDGRTKRMLPPLVHLDDCNAIHCNLQLSLLAYMVQKHNPTLKVGDLILNHVQFEEESRDQYDYPVYRKDEEGLPIVKNIEPIKMPYMKREVEFMFEWLKNNRHNLRKKS